MVAHACNTSSWEAETYRSLNLRPVWSIESSPGQPGLHREKLPLVTKSAQELAMNDFQRDKNNK